MLPGDTNVMASAFGTNARKTRMASVAHVTRTIRRIASSTRISPQSHGPRGITKRSVHHLLGMFNRYSNERRQLPVLRRFHAINFPKAVLVYGSIAFEPDGQGKMEYRSERSVRLGPNTARGFCDQTDPNKSRYRAKRGSEFKIATAKCVSSRAERQLFV